MSLAMLTDAYIYMASFDSKRRSAVPRSRSILSPLVTANFCLFWCILLMVIGGGAGCASYTDRLKSVYTSIDTGEIEGAVKRIDQLMGVAESGDSPATIGKDTPLLLLERGMLHHAMGNYKLSARDFGQADSNMEVLDLTGDSLGQVSRYLFSDDSSIYKGAPYEKLLINTMNMLNYLAMEDLSGAKVEARRMLVLEKYLEDFEEGKGLSSFGAYLAGFIFEKSGDYNQAIRFYGIALERGNIPGLVNDIVTLHMRTGVNHPSVAKVIKEWKQIAARSGARSGVVGGSGAGAGGGDSQEVLLVVLNGLSPRKAAIRLPIGRAMTHVHESRYRSSMTAKEWEQAQYFAAQGALKWLNYPGLERNRNLVDQRVGATVNGSPYPCAMALDIENQVMGVYEENQGLYMAAALSRMVARAVAGQVAGAVARQAGGREGSALGMLVSLSTEGLMMAADTPDTRSWTTLPAKVFVSRVKLPPGNHTLMVQAEGRGGVFRKAVNVDLPEGGFKVVSVATMR